MTADHHGRPSRRPDALLRREIAAQTATDKPAEAYEGLSITFSHGRYLPTLRSRESLDRAIRGDSQLLGERVRAGAVSYDEREFLDDLINGRIKPGKRLYNQRVVRARRQRVAKFVIEMERDYPNLQREAVVAEAMQRFRVARSEVFESLKDHKSNESE